MQHNALTILMIREVKIFFAVNSKQNREPNPPASEEALPS